MKRRLDDLIVARGLAQDLREARGLIMAGKVVVAGAVCNKAGTPTKEDAEIHVRGRREKYVSRGGYKLEAALERFAVDVTGLSVLDAGASTGGFTDCLLQHGAARVYAVDVGFGQLRGKLANDPRVVNMEKTNIGDLRPAQLDPLDLAVGDLSNLTLEKAVPTVAALFAGPPELVFLVKPLFEGVAPEAMADPEELGAGLVRLAERLGEQGFGIVDLAASPIRGSRSSVEFLARIRAEASADLTPLIASAVAAIPPVH